VSVVSAGGQVVGARLPEAGAQEEYHADEGGDIDENEDQEPDEVAERPLEEAAEEGVEGDGKVGRVVEGVRRGVGRVLGLLEAEVALEAADVLGDL